MQIAYMHACALSQAEEITVLLEVHTQVLNAEIALNVVPKSIRTAWYVCLSVCTSGECVSPESPCGLSAQGSESSADADVESSAAEADQDMPDDTG